MAKKADHGPRPAAGAVPAGGGRICTGYQMIVERPADPTTPLR